MQTGPAYILDVRSSVSHECRLGEGVHVAPAATLARVRYGWRLHPHRPAFDGTPTGAIGSNVIVGVVSVVTRNLPDGVVALGVPALFQRRIQPLRQKSMSETGANNACTIENTARDGGMKRLANKFFLESCDYNSNRIHEHALAKLHLSSLSDTPGSFLVEFGTVIKYGPEDAFPNRPWGRGNNPNTAVDDFLSETTGFVVDRGTGDKLLLTVAPGGYLKRVAS